MSDTPIRPEEIHNVSHSQFSIARHFGGIRFNGAGYTYDPTRDVLIRDDVLKARAAAERKAKRAAAERKAKRAAKVAKGKGGQPAPGGQGRP